MPDPSQPGPTTDSLGREMNMVVGVAAPAGEGTVTARKAGSLHDMMLPVSPSKVPLKQALHNLAKAINVAFQTDFLENELEAVYKAARVRNGTVEILHKDYIGLGDGVFAKVGKGLKSFQLTLRGPDPGSPQGKEWIEARGRGSIRGMLSFLGRKLDLIQEYEDKVPTYIEQLLDRLEAVSMITGWDRNEWQISTRLVGLDAVISPTKAEQVQSTSASTALS